MSTVLPILVIVVAAGIGLWLMQTRRMLLFAQKQVVDAWAELRAELTARREMVPYIVAAVQVNSEQIVELIGNACDLAANVAGVKECAQAEARLSAAIGRLFSLLDGLPDTVSDANVARLRDNLREHEARIAMLVEAYNRRAETFNTLLSRGSARVFISAAVFRLAELFG